MNITKDNLTFLTQATLSLAGLFLVTGSSIKSLASSFNYLNRLCSHMYDGWQKVLLTLKNYPTDPLAIILGILLFSGLIWAFFVLTKQIKETRRFAKENYTHHLKSTMAAFCHGLIHRSIFLNQTLLKKLSPLEIQAVVLHEEYHLKNFDNLKVLITRFLGRLLFFLPFIKNLGEAFEKEKEFAADSWAAKKVGALTVAAALYRLLETSSATKEENLIGNFTGATNRIERLLGEKSRKTNLSLRSWSISLLIIFFIALSFFQKPFALAQNQMLMPTEKANDVCNFNCIPYLHPKACSVPKNNS